MDLNDGMFPLTSNPPGVDVNTKVLKVLRKSIFDAPKNRRELDSVNLSKASLCKETRRDVLQILRDYISFSGSLICAEDRTPQNTDKSCLVYTGDASLGTSKMGGHGNVSDH